MRQLYRMNTRRIPFTAALLRALWEDKLLVGSRHWKMKCKQSNTSAMTWKKSWKLIVSFLRFLKGNMIACLEREFNLLKHDRDSLLQRISSSSEMLTQITNQKEKALKDPNCEVRRKKHEEEIKQFRMAFACRQRSITSFHTEFKSILETMKAPKPASISKSLGS